MITNLRRHSNEIAWYIRCPGCAHNLATVGLYAHCINPTCRLRHVQVKWDTRLAPVVRVLL